MRGPGKTPDKAGDSRAARLAGALRENLRRRKAQELARKSAAGTGGAEHGTAGPVTDDGGAAGARENGPDGDPDGPGRRSGPRPGIR